MHQLRRNPVDDILSIRRRMHRLVNAMAGPQNPLVFYSRLWEPALDVFETQAELVVTIEISGVSQDDIEVSLEHDILTISGERPDHITDGPEICCIHQREIDFGRFERSIRIPHPIRREEIKSSLRDGFLEIRMPKAPSAMERPVSVPID